MRNRAIYLNPLLQFRNNDGIRFIFPCQAVGTKFRRHAGQAWPPRLRASPMTSPGEASRDRRLPIGHVPDAHQDGIEEREPT